MLWYTSVVLWVQQRSRQKGDYDSKYTPLVQWGIGVCDVPSTLAQFDLRSIGGWLIVAIAAVAILTIMLKILRKVISTSIRLAIIVGALLVIAAALCALSAFLNGGRLPIS